jgi:hypothetical protein
MVTTRTTTAWANASLVLGILGWLTAVPLAFLDYGHIIGATAGVGMIGPFLIGLVAAVLCLLGVVFGVVALARARNGEFGGTGKAWTGIVVGALPLLVGVVVLWPSYFGW